MDCKLQPDYKTSKLQLVEREARLLANTNANTTQMATVMLKYLHEEILLVSPPAVAKLDALVIILAGAFCCNALFLVTIPIWGACIHTAQTSTAVTHCSWLSYPSGAPVYMRNKLQQHTGAKQVHRLTS